MILKNNVRKVAALPKEGEIMIIAFDDDSDGKELRAIKLEALEDQKIRITNLCWGDKPLYMEGLVTLLLKIAGNDSRLEKPKDISIHYNKSECVNESIVVCQKDEIEGWGIIEREDTRYERKIKIKDSYTCPIWLLPYLSKKNYNFNDLYVLYGEILPLQQEDDDEPYEEESYIQTEAPRD